MNLTIKQNNQVTEQVTSDLIDKLYNLTKEDVANGITAIATVLSGGLQGRIEAPAAYEDAVTYLNTKFGPNLIVSALSYYIRFADPEVVRVLTAKGIISEGGRLTTEQAAIANVGFRSLFGENTVVKNFDELRYFDIYKTADGYLAQQIFDRATNLESVDLTGIKSTGLFWAFRSCHSLEWYHGKSGPKNVLNLQWRNVPYIQAYAFYENYGLHEVTSLGMVTILENYCFQKCTNLTTIDISNITTIGTSTFEGDGNLEYFSGSDSTAGELNLPNLTGTLGDAAFKGCTKLTSITSLGNITSIGKEVFNGCTNLATINFPSTLTSVGRYAFNNTAWLNNQPDGVIYAGNVAYIIKGGGITSVSLASNTKSISSGFLGNNTYTITTLNLNEGLESIYEDSIVNSTLTSLHIPSTVTRFDNNRGFMNATSITVAANNTKYDSRDNCNAIIETATNKLIAGCLSTSIPNTVTSIGSRAFQGYDGQDFTIHIPSSVLNIDNYAFGQRLTAITFDEGITQIKDIFNGCYRLTSIAIPNSVTSIVGGAFYFQSANWSQPENTCLSGGITFGTGLTTIAAQTFVRCKFTSLDLPANITTIENYAIDNCTLLQSIIMRGVTSIGDKAFRGSALTSITIETSSVPTISGTSFANDNGQYINNGNFTIYVPSNLLSSYQTAPNWSTLYSDGKIQAIST